MYVYILTFDKIIEDTKLIMFFDIQNYIIISH